MPFRALGLDTRILQAVKEAGYTEPTPIQLAAIPPVLAGQDVIGIAQTGTGKTAAFTLPILTRLTAGVRDVPPPGTRALVLAPTRELAVQIEENIRAYARHLPLKVATVFGGVGERAQIDALRAGTTIIVACPGRLLDLMGRRYADFTRLQHLILDEADRMLDMGFLPSIRQIVRALPTRRQTLLFSATLSQEIESLTREFQHQPKLVQIGRRSNPAETVSQWVYEVSKAQKPALLAHLLQEPDMNMVLVFSRMKHGADRIAKQLQREGIPTATLHSNRSQNQRLRALADFKSGAVRVLVATDIAARGIDVDGISHVINYDFPPHAEDYVHRIGRTGRAHAIGDAISFVTPEDHSALRSLERFIGRGILRRRAEGFTTTPAHASPASSSHPSEPRSQGSGHVHPSRNPARPQPTQRPQDSRSQSAQHQPRSHSQGDPQRSGPRHPQGSHRDPQRPGGSNRPPSGRPSSHSSPPGQSSNRPFNVQGQPGQQGQRPPARPGGPHGSSHRARPGADSSQPPRPSGGKKRWNRPSWR